VCFQAKRLQAELVKRNAPGAAAPRRFCPAEIAFAQVWVARRRISCETRRMSDFSELPYRPCVGVMLVNPNGHVFVGRRIDNREGDFWQMPQGGIDQGEDLIAAAWRELREETGVGEEHATLLAQTKDELLYDLPEELMGKLWGGKYRGQRQYWVLARFTGQDADIDLEAHDPAEFCEWKWIEPGLLPELIVPFKKRVYRAVIEEFGELI
jgi:putative (di)nucleoside polyphosphate hydrolase